MDKTKMEIVELNARFQKAFGHPVRQHPTKLTNERFFSRLKWLQEEVDELEEAFRHDDFEGQCDALMDILYITAGTINEMGLGDWAAKMYRRVQNSNMSKLGRDGKPIYGPDGKIQKGPNYFEPQLGAMLEEANIIVTEAENVND